MAFNIIKGEDLRVNSIIVLLYGDIDAGKTSTAFTASKPILFDFDGGAHRSNQKQDKPIVRVSKWEEMTVEYPRFDKVFADYDTVIIDTVDTCLDLIRIYVENQDFKLKKNKLQMFGALKDEFFGFLNRLTKLGKDIIFIAHSTQDEKNGIMVTHPKITGGSKDLVRQKADFVGYMFTKNNEKTLNFNSTDYWEGKNSAKLPELTLPDYNVIGDYFTSIMRKMKESLNSLNKQQDDSIKRMKELFGEIEALKNVNDLNQFYSKLPGLGLKNGEADQVKVKMRTVLPKFNCQFDKDKMMFVEIPIPEPQKDITPITLPPEVVKEVPKTESFVF